MLSLIGPNNNKKKKHHNNSNTALTHLIGVVACISKDANNILFELPDDKELSMKHLCKSELFQMKLGLKY